MNTTPPSPVRVAIIIDVYDQPLLTTLIWAQRTGHDLTAQLWDHGVLAHLHRVEIDPYQTLTQ
jgi:hypothetical protein